jgi:hypothetical protein
MAMEAPVIAALVTGVVSLLTSGGVTLWVARRRTIVDKEVAKLKGKLDESITELKARLENRTLFQAEHVAHELLMMPAWDLRSFDAFKHRLGGFQENEIRQVLIRAGALQFKGKGGKEMWGLLARNRHRLERKPTQEEQTAADLDDTD